jgi:septum formation protein
MLDSKFSMTTLPKLILASASPRRAEILSSVGWEFEKHVADVDESLLPNENAEDHVKRLALKKAEAVAKKYKDAWILGADTIVVIDGEIIGKPKDLDDARRMLKMLSGKWHEVFTGVAIVKCEGRNATVKERVNSSRDCTLLDSRVSASNETCTGLQKTGVKFAELSDEEIEFLVRCGEPLDKAGAYAVQAQAALFIEEIRGDYWNVVGLPVNLVYELVRKCQNPKR